MRALRTIAVAAVLAGLLFYGGFSALAAGSDTTAGQPEIGSKAAGRAAGPLALAYLAGKTGRSPADLHQAIQDEGLDSVLQAAGVSPEQLRTVLRDIRELYAARPGHARRHAHVQAVMARALAELSGKPVAEIVQMRRELGDWNDVIDRLGLERADVRAKIRDLLRKRADSRWHAEPRTGQNGQPGPQAGTPHPEAGDS
ncbi:MAG TPA: hypothetical protein VIK92_02765 [Thermaerobacter sp.]